LQLGFYNMWLIHRAGLATPGIKFNSSHSNYKKGQDISESRDDEDVQYFLQHYHFKLAKEK